MPRRTACAARPVAQAATAIARMTSVRRRDGLSMVCLRPMVSSRAARASGTIVRARPAAPMHKLYPLFRPLLFAADPELAHEIAFAGLDAATKTGIARLLSPRLAPSPVEVMGIRFPNRVGL